MNPPITPAGNAWLTAVLDPFHDYITSVQGIPDGNPSPSYTRLYNQTFTAGASAANDTIRIQFDGLVHPSGWSTVSQVGNGYNYNPASLDLTTGTYQIGPVSIIRAPYSSGNVDGYASFDSLKWVTPSSLLGSLDLSLDVETPHRIIAMGIEVHDITAPLYRQGSIAVCSPSGATQTDTHRYLRMKLSSGDDQYALFGHAVITPSLPASRKIASTLPNFLEWEAEKGCYLTVPLTHLPKVHPYAVRSADSTARPSTQSLGIVEECAGSQGNCNWTYIGINPTNVNGALTQSIGSFDSGFQPVQIWLSGLAAQSSFKVVLRTLVEFFPEVADLSTIANAVSPTTADPAVFTEYQRRRSVLPIAVPVSMNAKGDWWRMVKSAGKAGANLLRTGAPTALTLMGQPHLASAATIGFNQIAEISRLISAKKTHSQPPSRQKNTKQKRNK